MEKRKGALRFLFTIALSALLGALAYAQIDKAIKGAAIFAAVDKFGPDINKGVNRLTGDNKLGSSAATKVVPIISLGNGTAVGAVQVTGPQSRLDRVKAVGQIDGKVKILGEIRLKALVPIESRSLTNVKRVPGVGVSALVDIKL